MSKNLADNIVALRKKHGLSQEQFAEKIGVTRQAVSNWERRIATPDVETLDLIAKLFDTDLTAMVNGESTGTEKPRDTLRYRRVLLLASAALTAVHFVLAFSGRIPMFPVVIAPGVLLHYRGREGVLPGKFYYEACGCIRNDGAAHERHGADS
mgnify:CR=1 FL=1